MKFAPTPLDTYSTPPCGQECAVVVACVVACVVAVVVVAAAVVSGHALVHGAAVARVVQLAESGRVKTSHTNPDVCT